MGFQQLNTTSRRPRVTNRVCDGGAELERIYNLHGWKPLNGCDGRFVHWGAALAALSLQELCQNWSVVACTPVIRCCEAADNLDAASNLFLGRELVTRLGFVDDDAMEAETRKIMGRLNPNFKKFDAPVSALSGGQRQSVAIARAVYFEAKILIMDEPTAALGPQETQMVAELIQELKKDGLGIFLIDHDIHSVMQTCDRAAVMKNGKVVGTVKVDQVTEDDLLGMIILGKCPPGAIPGPGAINPEIAAA